MSAPAAKRRKTSSPEAIDAGVSPLKKRPIRRSFASPTKASLARFNPGLLPSARSTEQRGSLGGEAIAKGRDSRAYILGNEATNGKHKELRSQTNDQGEGDAGELTGSQALKTTPRNKRTGKIGGMDGAEDDELPETPDTRALAQKDTPRRGILYSTPSKRPPRQKNATEEPQHDSNEQRPSKPENQTDDARPENQDAKAGAEQGKEPDPLVEKKLEKERLLRMIEDLEEEVDEYAELLGKEQGRSADEIIDTEDLDALVYVQASLSA
jgi:hypothetical protein